MGVRRGWTNNPFLEECVGLFAHPLPLVWRVLNRPLPNSRPRRYFHPKRMRRDQADVLLRRRELPLKMHDFAEIFARRFPGAVPKLHVTKNVERTFAVVGRRRAVPQVVVLQPRIAFSLLHIPRKLHLSHHFRGLPQHYFWRLGSQRNHFFSHTWANENAWPTN